MNWFQTFTGRAFHLEDLDQNEIDILDIAHSLSMQCRFGGHSKQFYSIAEHSVRVARVLPPDLQLRGLLHDAAEAYLQDTMRPRKLKIAAMAPSYAAWEDRVEQLVLGAFGLSGPMPNEVKVADVRLLMTERRDLLNPCERDWEYIAALQGLEPLPEKIVPWSQDKAQVVFLEMFCHLSPTTTRSA